MPHLEGSVDAVDAVDVTILVDNYVDSHIQSRDVARQPVRPFNYFERPNQLRAEFGFATLLTIHSGGHRETLLYDAGMGRDTLLNNCDALEMSIPDIRAVVISHGHADHHGGLEGLLGRLGRTGIPVVIHPHAFRDRKIVYPSGAEIRQVPPTRASLLSHGVELVDERGPTMLVGNHVLVTGRIPRRTDFEAGYPWHHARSGATWKADPWIWDDQAIAVNVRGRGLVVLTGCGHAGIVNTLRHAQRLTGVREIALAAGGMHLTGGAFDDRISRTISELLALNPAWVAPGHCTGWKATHGLSQFFGKRFIQTSVGMTLRIEAPGDASPVSNVTEPPVAC